MKNILEMIEKKYRNIGIGIMRASYIIAFAETAELEEGAQSEVEKPPQRSIPRVISRAPAIRNDIRSCETAYTQVQFATHRQEAALWIKERDCLQPKVHISATKSPLDTHILCLNSLIIPVTLC